MDKNKKNTNKKKADETEKGEKEAIRALRLEFIKPLNTSWQNAGKALRVAHQTCIQMARQAQIAIQNHNTDIYELIAADDDGKLQLPTKETKDGPKLDLPNFDQPKDLYRRLRDLYPFLNSNIPDQIIRAVLRKFNTNKLQILKAKPYEFNFKSQPIIVRSNSWKIEKVINPNATKYTDQYVVTFSLMSKDAKGFEGVSRFQFILSSNRLHNWQKWVLDDLVSGKQKDRTLKIYPKKKKGKIVWKIDIPYNAKPIAKKRMEKKKVKLEFMDNRTLVVMPPRMNDETNLGFLRCYVVRDVEIDYYAPWWMHPDQKWVLDLEHHSVKTRLESIERRRKSMSTFYRQSPKRFASREEKPASVGHGRRRALQPKEGLSDERNNALTSFCTQRACTIIDYAIKKKCGTIEMMDLPNLDRYWRVMPNFPYYELVQRVRNKAEALGIKFVLLDPKKWLANKEATKLKKRNIA